MSKKYIEIEVVIKTKVEYVPEKYAVCECNWQHYGYMSLQEAINYEKESVVDDLVEFVDTIYSKEDWEDYITVNVKEVDSDE